MSVTYGSDNPDCVKVEQLDAALPLPARSTRPKWRKVALAMAGTALCIGSAFVMYEGWNSVSNRTSVASGVSTASDMTLESQAAQALSDVKHDYNLLKTGAKIMLRVRGKANFCVDDGGGWGAASTKASNFPCNPTSLNQVFTYDAKTRQFRSVNKPGLCLDDGGGWDAASTKALLWYCDPNNQNQWFVMDQNTQMLKSPVKNNLCLDDGGTYVAREKSYVMWHCDNSNPNQHFDVLSWDAMAAEKKKLRAASGNTAYDTLMSGQQIMLRMRGKNLCADDGGGWGAASTKFVDKPCNPTSLNQAFTYDPKTYMFHSVSKPGLCLDDGGGWKAASTNALLWYCDPNNQNQWFVMDDDTLMLRSPVKENLCLDDGGGTTTQYVLWNCDNNNVNQHWEVLSRSDMAEQKKALRASTGNTAYDVLMSGQEVMLRVRGKNMCVDDGGGKGAASTNVIDKSCNPNSPNQVFKYDPKTFMFYSVNKPGLCLDDGGGWNARSTNAVLWNCDPNNQNQWFYLDDDTLLLRSPAKGNLCLDDGGGTTAGTTKFELNDCSNDSPNQHFEVLSRSAFAEERKKTRIASGVQSQLDILKSSQEIMLRVHGKDNLCLDDGGGLITGYTNFVDMPCNPNSPNQIFKYDSTLQQFRSVSKPGFCMDDGGSMWSNGAIAHLRECDPNNQNQWFVVDEDTLSLVNPSKNNLCLDDGGAMKAGATQYTMTTCSADNANQRFDILFRAAFADERKGLRTAAGVQDDFDALYSGDEIMLRLRGKGDLCVDDGGGQDAGQSQFIAKPCNPSSPSQIFTYDVKTTQFKSAKKPNLCFDDGRAQGGAGSTQMFLWYCDPQSLDQLFEMDDLLMLRNPAKPTLCIDDGGGNTAGATMFRLWPCMDESPDQHFEVLSRTAMTEENKNARAAAGIQDDVEIFKSGQDFVLRVRGKDNLCVDDGGGRWAKITDQQCDPSSPNQAFKYDASTRQIRSVDKPDLCVDDVGSQGAGWTQMQLWACEPNRNSQWFVMDEDTQMIRNPSRDNLCIDDGGGTEPGATMFRLWSCSNGSPDQQFEVLSRAAFAEEKKKARIAAGTDDDYTALTSGREIMIRVQGTDLCLDDGGASSSGNAQFTNKKCSPNNHNQIFTYKADSHQLVNTYKQGMCIDGGGGTTGFGWSMPSPFVQYWWCDFYNKNQLFYLDEMTLQLRNPATKTRCLDGGGGTTPGATKYAMSDCNPDSPSQHFELIPRTVMNESRVAAGIKTDIDLMASALEIMFRVRGKNNLCMGDGGGLTNGETNFTTEVCDADSPNQIFTYDFKTRQIRSVNKPGMCMDDGGSWIANNGSATLWECQPWRWSQWFALDEDTSYLKNPAKPNLCVDDGGGLEANYTMFVMWECNEDNPNLRFEVLSRAEFVEDPNYRLSAPLYTGPAVMDGPLVPHPKMQPPVVSIENEGPGLRPNDVDYVNPDVEEGPSPVEQPPDVIEEQPPTETDHGLVDFEGPGLIVQPPEVTEEQPPNDYVNPDVVEESPGLVEQPPQDMDNRPPNEYVNPGGIIAQPPEVTEQQSPTEYMNPDEVVEGLGLVDQLPQPSESEGLPALPSQDENAPPPNIPVVKTADMPMANYSGDWNLLAPSNETISRVNSDNSPQISAAKIFQYLQSLKDKAEVEYSIMMYRYKRTYQCASAGLQTLAKDSVTTDEYHVLVRWMYEHCAAGSTEIAPPLKPMPPLPKDALNATDVAPLLNDTATDVKRQYMTKMDFYYEIKNHFSNKSEKMMGSAAEANLRSETTKEQEKKLIDCIDASSARFEFNGPDSASLDLMQILKKAIDWVENTCMAS